MTMNNIYIGKKYKCKETDELFYVNSFSRLEGINRIGLINQQGDRVKITEEAILDFFIEVEEF